MLVVSVHTGGWLSLNLRGNLSLACHCSSCSVYVNVLLQGQLFASSCQEVGNQLIFSAFPREDRPGAKSATFSSLTAVASIPYVITTLDVQAVLSDT